MASEKSAFGIGTSPTMGQFLGGIQSPYTTSATSLAERIRDEMYARRPAPGSRLFALSDISKEAGIGVGVVREALQRLSAIGLVEVRRGPKGGVYAKEVGSEVVSKSLGALVSANGISRHTVIEARLEIEGLCARLAALHATKDDLRRLSDSVERTREVRSDSARFSVENVTFHMAVAEATHNDVIVAFTQSVRDLFFEETVSFGYQSDALEQALHAHENLVEYISDGRAEDAFRLMRSHIHEFNRYVERSGQTEHVAEQTRSQHFETKA